MKKTEELKPLNPYSFHPVPGHLLNLVSEDKIGANDILLYLFLRSYSRDEEVCFPAVATLAANMRVSERTVQRSVQKLVDNDIILRKKNYSTLLWRYKKGVGVISPERQSKIDEDIKHISVKTNKEIKTVTFSGNSRVEKYCRHEEDVF